MMLRGKRLEEIRWENIEELIANGVAEWTDLEYKQELPGRNDEAKKEFLADVSAMANTRGGTIIYGIEEDGDERGQGTGVPASICGVGKVSTEEEKTRLEAIVRDGLDPKVRVELKHLTQGERTIVLLRVPRSLLAPHCVWYQRSGKFFRRGASGKYQADVREVREMFLETQEWRERTRTFRQERIRLTLDGSNPMLPDRKGAFFLHIVPLGFRPGALDICEAEANAKLFGQQFESLPNRFNLDGYLLDCPGTAGRWQYLQIFRNASLEFYRRGLLREARSQLFIDAEEFERWVVRLTVGAGRFYGAVGIEPPIAVFATFLKVMHAEIPYADWARGREAEPENHLLDRENLLLPDLVLEEFPGDVPRAARAVKPILDAFWQAGNWPSSPYFNADGSWKLVLADDLR